MFSKLKEIIEYIFQRLVSYRQPNSSNNNNQSHGINSVNTSKACPTCNKPHGPTCYVEHPEQAPKQKQAYFRKLKEQLQTKGQTRDQQTTSPQVGFISSVAISDETIYLDSGTEAHIIKDRYRFTEFKPHYRIFQTANGTTLTAKGIGSIQIYSPDLVTINNVFYCPES